MTEFIRRHPVLGKILYALTMILTVAVCCVLYVAVAFIGQMFIGICLIGIGIVIGLGVAFSG